jgi:hypothetical protein
MYLYVELWRAKDAWLKLSKEQRKAKLNQLQQAAAANPIPGVTPFSFRQASDKLVFDGVTTQPVIVDEAVARPTGFRYVAAWMIATRDLLKKFERRVEDLGWWFEYFEQKNAWGEIDTGAATADMIGLSRSTTPLPAQPPVGMGRFGRTEYAVARLRDDVEELKKGIHVVVDYVRTEQNRK